MAETLDFCRPVRAMEEDEDEAAACREDLRAMNAQAMIPDVMVFRDEEEEEDEDEEESRKSPADGRDWGISIRSVAIGEAFDRPVVPRHPPPFVDPEPHVSSQFYTFNRESHALMVRCILDRRIASVDEIRRATPPGVLKSWRSVWKDRNEDTAYLTAWKRIQDKLNAHHDSKQGETFLYFKSNASQYVSHTDQWQEIVTSFHGDADLRHLGLKDTIDRIKQVWTVGAKFYGIPESFIRVCVASCPICSGSGPASNSGRTKRRRFEYTESFDVPAKEVPARLQQLAAKHKVVLCIRQKYIRYKPFMAEVKDYACHRAGEPSSSSTAGGRKSKLLKREPYASKRCGCGFRIRAIVPISNYNEKDKTFVYQEEGTAVFKLYAIHTGHEPGPLDGNARIIHRIIGYRGGGADQDPIYGVSEEAEPDSYVSLLGEDEKDELQLSVLQQVQELKAEARVLEGKLMQMPRVLLNSLSQELTDIISRVRSACEGSIIDKQHRAEDVSVVGDEELGHWDGDPRSGHDRLYGKHVELIEEEEEEDSIFGRTLRSMVPWDRMRDECESTKAVMRDTCKSDKWLLKDCEEFDEKSILCSREVEESKLIKPVRHDGGMVTDPNLVIQVDGFYTENTKWYDSPCGLDTPGTDCVDGGFRHGGIL
ncbi:uncharacterized protein LOC144710034 [Wolffia australiana]